MRIENYFVSVTMKKKHKKLNENRFKHTFLYYFIFISNLFIFSINATITRISMSIFLAPSLYAQNNLTINAVYMAVKISKNYEIQRK